MSKDLRKPVSRAEGLKHSEIRQDLGESEGARPVRKKGYYRALKRQVPWAVHDEARRKMITTALEAMYSDLVMRLK